MLLTIKVLLKNLPTEFIFIHSHRKGGEVSRNPPYEQALQIAIFGNQKQTINQAISSDSSDEKALMYNLDMFFPNIFCNAQQNSNTFLPKYFNGISYKVSVHKILELFLC